MIYNGYSVIEDSKMVVPDGFKEVKRTIKDRLFSLPWRPLVKFNYVAKYKPSSQVIVNEQYKQMIMHPAIAQELRNLNKKAS